MMGISFMSYLTRDVIEECLNKRLTDHSHGYRQNIGVLGTSGVGKTYLLQNLYQSISRQRVFLPVYIKADVIDGKQMIEQWLCAVLASPLLEKRLDMPRSFPELLRTTETIIPKTVEAVKSIRRLLRQEKNAAAIRELLALVSVLSQETNKKVVLMIDEFQALEKLPASDVFLLLGKQMMIDKDTLYVVSSSAIDIAREIFLDKLSLLFGNFEILELSPFSYLEMEQYLAAKMPAYNLSFDLKNFIFKMTGGEPFYLDLLRERIERNETCNFPQEISSAILINAFCQELFDSYGRISLLFEKKMVKCSHIIKYRGAYVRAMLALSHGRHKILSIATFIEQTVSETQKILRHLLEDGLIEKCGTFYHIPDVLFRFWLREVFQRRLDSYIPEERILRKHLFDALNEILAFFVKAEASHLGFRVESFLKEFRNDSLEINAKKITCPQFSEVAVNGKWHNDIFSLTGKSSKGRWLFYVCQENLNESEAEKMLVDLKRFRKIKKRILIALRGVDENARLIVQEAKMQVWDLATLNRLFDLYDQPGIIITSHKGTNEFKASYQQNVGTVAHDVSAFECR